MPQVCDIILHRKRLPREVSSLVGKDSNFFQTPGLLAYLTPLAVRVQDPRIETGKKYIVLRQNAQMPRTMLRYTIERLPEREWRG